MKKYTMILILCIIFILGITGCQKADNDKPVNTGINTENTEINTENTEVNTENTEVNTENTEVNTENTEVNTENTEVSTENTEINTENIVNTEEPETQNQEISDSGDTALTEEEIKWFETSFLNTPENRIVNLFLVSEYHDAKDVDLYELFYGGSNTEDASASKEEVQLLKKRYDIMDLDVLKVTTDEMNDILQKYIGMSLEETNKKNLDGLYYLEEYDAYYSVAGDTNYIQYDLERGWKNEDGTITIEYLYYDMFNAEEKMYGVTLKEVDGNYLFVSNEAVK